MTDQTNPPIYTIAMDTFTVVPHRPDLQADPKLSDRSSNPLPKSRLLPET